MQKAYIKDNLKLFVGVVEGDPQKFERDGKAVAVITLRDYMDERIKIYFNNGEHSASKHEMRADRIANARVSNGAFLTVLASCDDPEEKTATGIDFKYRGIWNFSSKDGKPTTVLMGVACRPRSPKAGMFCVTVPVDEYKDGKNQTIWVDATFFDSERDGKKQENATRAQKVLGNAEKPVVVITGTGVQENQYNGNVYHNMVAYRITRKPD